MEPRHSSSQPVSPDDEDMSSVGSSVTWTSASEGESAAGGSPSRIPRRIQQTLRNRSCDSPTRRFWHEDKEKQKRSKVSAIKEIAEEAEEISIYEEYVCDCSDDAQSRRYHKEAAKSPLFSSDNPKTEMTTNQPSSILRQALIPLFVLLPVLCFTVVKSRRFFI